MFVPRIGQRLFLSLALGLGLFMPTICLGSHVLQHPFNSFSATLIPSTSVVGSVSIAHSGTVPGATYFGTADLTNNDLIVTASNETTAQFNYTNVLDMVTSGYGVNGDWTGKGITSTTTAFDIAHSSDAVSPTPGVTALGVILNDDGSASHPDGSGNPIYTSFDGVTGLNQYAVLVKYTFVGDTDLEGQVTPFDQNIAVGSLGVAGGWVNGATTYFGGNVSPFDIQQLTAAIGLQSSYPFTSPAAGVGGASVSVPEPSSIAMILIAGAASAITLLGRRRLAAK
jgi:hypothetical protein